MTLISTVWQLSRRISVINAENFFLSIVLQSVSIKEKDTRETIHCLFPAIQALCIGIQAEIGLGQNLSRKIRMGLLQRSLGRIAQGRSSSVLSYSSRGLCVGIW